MRRRVCRDCPVPNCGARYLAKLSNHLTDVHELDYYQRRKWLQEAKLQPKVKIMIYDDEHSKGSGKKRWLSANIKHENQDEKIVCENHTQRRGFYKKTKRKGHLSKKRKL